MDKIRGEAKGANEQIHKLQNVFWEQNKEAADGQDSKSPAKKGEEAIAKQKQTGKPRR